MGSLITFVGVKISELLSIRIVSCVLLCSKIGVAIAQSDTANKWTFGLYADTYLGLDLLYPNNQEQGISELVSFNRFKEFAINSAIGKVNFQDSLVRFSAGIGTGTYFIKNLSAEPMGYRNIFECYGGLKLSSRNSIWLDAGIMPSHIGYESAISMDQPTLTRSLVSDFSPYYETGVKISKQTSNSSFSLLWLNGWQRIWRNPKEAGTHLGSQFTFNQGGFFLNYSGYYGGLGTGNTADIRIFHDLFTKIKLRDNFQIWLLMDWGSDNVGNDRKLWWGMTSVVQYKLNKQLSTALRAERFKDNNNRIIVSAPLPANIGGYSWNIDYSLNTAVVLRAEIKQFYSDRTIFYNQDASFSNKSLQGIVSIAWKL